MMKILTDAGLDPVDLAQEAIEELNHYAFEGPYHAGLWDLKVCLPTPHSVNPEGYLFLEILKISRLLIILLLIMRKTMIITRTIGLK